MERLSWWSAQPDPILGPAGKQLRLPLGVCPSEAATERSGPAAQILLRCGSHGPLFVMSQMPHFSSQEEGKYF